MTTLRRSPRLLAKQQKLTTKPGPPIIQRETAEGSPLVSHPDRWCVIPENQPVYQALMDKADSYPADKVWQAKAYRNAALNLLTYTSNIFDTKHYLLWTLNRGIGYSIETFVDNFITEFQHLPDVLNYLE
jgi:hypothetical protein